MIQPGRPFLLVTKVLYVIFGNKLNTELYNWTPIHIRPVLKISTIQRTGVDEGNMICRRYFNAELSLWLV